MQQRQRRPIRAILVLATVSLLALPAAASATPSLTVTPSPDSVEAPGGVVTYTVTASAAWSGMLGAVVEERIDSMTDSVSGSLAECGPFPRGWAFEIGPVVSSQTLCSFTRLVSGPPDSEQTIFVYASGAAGEKREKGSTLTPWTTLGSASVHVKGPPRTKCGSHRRLVVRHGKLRCVRRPLHRGRGRN